MTNQNSSLECQFVREIVKFYKIFIHILSHYPHVKKNWVNQVKGLYVRIGLPSSVRFLISSNWQLAVECISSMRDPNFIHIQMASMLDKTSWQITKINFYCYSIQIQIHLNPKKREKPANNCIHYLRIGNNFHQGYNNSFLSWLTFKIA